MKKLLKWVVIIFSGLIGLLVLTGLVLYPVGKKKITRSYPDIAIEKIKISTDANAITHGKHISIIWGCTRCHGTDLGGTLMKKDPMGGNISTLGAIPASNLTTGKGGVGKYYTDEDWIRSIRHGIKPDHHAIIFMYVSKIHDQDLGDLIAYLKQISPVDKEFPASRYGPFIPIASAFYPPAASSIDHNASHLMNSNPGVTGEYGKYLSSICSSCHGNTIGNSFKKWKQEDFVQTFHTGVLPNGKKFGPTMSSQTFLELNDTELNSLWAYFHK